MLLNWLERIAILAALVYGFCTHQLEPALWCIGGYIVFRLVTTKRVRMQ